MRAFFYLQGRTGFSKQPSFKPSNIDIIQYFQYSDAAQQIIINNRVDSFRHLFDINNLTLCQYLEQ